GFVSRRAGQSSGQAGGNGGRSWAHLVPTGGRSPASRYRVYQPVTQALKLLVWPKPSRGSSRGVAGSRGIRTPKSYRVAGSFVGCTASTVCEVRRFHGPA